MIQRIVSKNQGGETIYIIANENGIVVIMDDGEGPAFFEKLQTLIEVEHNAATPVSDDDEGHYMIEQLLEDYKKLS